jgi:hypothetical protein
MGRRLERWLRPFLSVLRDRDVYVDMAVARTSLQCALNVYYIKAPKFLD